MKRLSFGLALLLTLFVSPQIKGQDLSDYRWEKRLVVLLADDEAQPYLEEQIKAFKTYPEGLEERKLQVITVKPNAFRIGIEKQAWKPGGFLYKRYRQQGSFAFILIGLDGGEKLRRQEVMPLKELYRIIDSMPMRAAEMRRKNN